MSELKVQFCCLFHRLKISSAMRLAQRHTDNIAGCKNSEINQCLEPGNCREADSNLVGFTEAKMRVLPPRSTAPGAISSGKEEGMRAPGRTRGAWPAGFTVG